MTAPLSGLSPRTRGSHVLVLPALAVVRPIPADAGEPHSSLPVGGCRRAYPRGRGGACSMSSSPRRHSGLSPRTRGSPTTKGSVLPTGGPIPADAGEPTYAMPSEDCPGAYPRGRGGAVTVQAPDAVREGLSPRTRGSPPHIRAVIDALGPIPADAGEPSSAGVANPAGGAYPRGRGGAAFRQIPSHACSGLSPRTRGSQQHGRAQIEEVGPIPADAGEPDCRWAGGADDGAYPRGRGGARRPSRPGSAPAGLSPRTRGSHVLSDL